MYFGAIRRPLLNAVRRSYSIKLVKFFEKIVVYILLFSYYINTNLKFYSL